ncbi:histone-like nucleoid-structuring protein Lsr2 [Microbacterium gorillae]|uniref:histone-like nucleoid-structuring protein Lsr2 n=1 Tax=Microbacterium gorillae TaxID=1231063 RepID=UPI003D95BF32
MAKKIIHQLVDDLDNTVLEPGEGETVLFAVDGRQYEIDLTVENAAILRGAFAPYIQAGRKISGGTKLTRSTGTRRNDLAAVRAWARENGYTVSDRGRIPAHIEAEFDAR